MIYAGIDAEAFVDSGVNELDLPENEDFECKTFLSRLIGWMIKFSMDYTATELAMVKEVIIEKYKITNPRQINLLFKFISEVTKSEGQHSQGIVFDINYSTI
jgi:hypothetical protein